MRVTATSSASRSWPRGVGLMAYDVELAGRIRDALEGESGLTEKKMFGGLAFLVGGHMAIAASGQGDALVRATRPSRTVSSTRPAPRSP